MSTLANAKYQFGLKEVLILPLNADFTTPSTTNIIGGIGPFDFSGEAVPTAIPFKSKIDSGAIETVNVDLSGASSISAVTVAELFAAINLAAPTDLTASAEAVTGRLKIAYSGAGSPTYVQVWGPAAEIGEIGQGKGVRFAYSNTMLNMTDTPTLKEQELITVTDANGIDTEIQTDGYRKGVSGSFGDTAAIDWYMRSIVEGGTYDETALYYEVPTVNDAGLYFMMIVINAIYGTGTSKERDLTGYVRQEIYSAKGTFGDRTKERGWVNAVYNYTATSPKDSGVVTADSKEFQMTTAEYQAADYIGLATY
jgi:hypothetical protein